MGEWLNPAVLKTVIRKYRGFESPSLFQNAITRDKLECFPAALLNDSFQLIISTAKNDLIEIVAKVCRFSGSRHSRKKQIGEMPERPIGADC